MKVCSKCGLVKENTDFHKRKERKGGLASACKMCRNAKSKKYNDANRQRLSKLEKAYRQTKHGKLSRLYSTMKQSTKRRGHTPIDYSCDDFMEWSLYQKIFHTLFDIWEASGYQKKFAPSVDRIDEKIGYVFSNMQIVTWIENNNNSHKAKINGTTVGKLIPVIQYFNGEEVGRFFSVAEASRHTGISSKLIYRVVSGERKTTYGFEWIGVR